MQEVITANKYLFFILFFFIKFYLEIEKLKCSFLFTSPFSPDFQPIEELFGSLSAKYN